MKKSVVILIGVIYIASVVLVSFFGQAIKMFEPVIYPERIEIVNAGQKHSEMHGDYIVIFPNANGEWVTKIEYSIYPENATEKAVDFELDKQSMGVTLEENGVIRFAKAGITTVVTVTVKDSSVSDTLTIMTANY